MILKKLIPHVTCNSSTRAHLGRTISEVGAVDGKRGLRVLLLLVTSFSYTNHLENSPNM